MIRLVTLDFWQTLFAETPEGLRRSHALRLAGVRAALARAGHPLDAAAVDAADARALAAFEAVWSRDRSMSPAEQVRMFLEAVDPGLPGALSADAVGAVTRAYEEPVLGHGPELAPGAALAIAALRAEGLAVGLISNTGRTPGRVLRLLLARAGVLDAFAVLSFSDELGVRKPAPAIFLRTLAATGVNPAHAAHLGDDADRDVAGARAAGMRAVHYVPDGRPPSPAADAALRHFRDLPALVARLA